MDKITNNSLCYHKHRMVQKEANLIDEDAGHAERRSVEAGSIRWQIVGLTRLR